MTTKEIEYQPAEKPLNQGQVRNLKELVQGDFANLREQIMADIESRLSRRKAEIENRYRDMGDLEAARERLTQAGRDAEDTLAAVVSEITNGNIKFKRDNSGYNEKGSYRGFAVKVYPEYLIQEGFDKDLKRAEEAAGRLRTIARKVIDREMRTVNRQVLLQGIGAAGALELVRDLPQASDVMALVAREMMTTSQDDVRELMLEGEIQAAEAIEDGDDE